MPENVFDKKSLESYKGKPIIITHDAGEVDKENVRREQIGTIMSEGYRDGDSVRCEIIIHDTSKTGTIRIGGTAYNATLGQLLKKDIEIEIDSNLQIVDFLQSGQSVAGLKPNKAKKGMIIPKDILIDGSTYLQKYNMPASGRQTSGGGVLADSLSVDVQSGIQAEENIMLGTSTEIYASPEHKAGKAYKTLAVSSSETEADVNVFIASATIRRCGTRSCGNKE